MYTLIDGVQFYDKDEVDDLFAQNGSAGLSDRLDQEAIDRAAADDALGARIDQETQELSDKLTQEADRLTQETQELSDKLTQESNMRLLGDQTLTNQLTAIEQLWSTLVSANFIDTDSSTIVSDDSGKSVRQIAHDEFYRQLVTDADDVKHQLDTLKELADYLQNNPTILTDIYTKLGLTWSLDTPTDFGTFDFSRVLTATDVDSAIVELHNTLVSKVGDLTQLTTTFKGNLDAEIVARTQADTALGDRITASVGTLSSLTTTAKDNLVAAVNEVQSEVNTTTSTANTAKSTADTNKTAIGTLSSLTTTAKTNLVSAINEVNGKVGTGGGDTGSTASNCEQFTFVVDSDAALAAWANNDKSGGQDYTSVLIRKGTWTSNTGVNLTTAGTKVVVGETGSKLAFNNVNKGLYYDTAPTAPDYYMRGVTVTVTVPAVNGSGCGFHSCTNLTNCNSTGSDDGTGDGYGNSFGYGFHSCTNLTNCTGSGTGNSTGDGFYSCTNLTNCNGTGSGNRGGVGFRLCTNLTNCNGTGSDAGFIGCTNLTNCTGTGTGSGPNGYGAGFHSCTNLANCTGTGTGTGTGSGNGSGYGFYSCTVVIGCKAGGHCTTAVFQECYASISKTSAYACADTANGGFNNTTNPQ